MPRKRKHGAYSAAGDAARVGSSFARVAALLLLSVGFSGCVREPDRHAKSSFDVVSNPPATFELDGKRLCFAGANNYYVASKPKPMVDDVFASAKALGFPVLRIWAYLDIAALDGSVAKVDPHADSVGRKDGVYFQYWDPKLARPRYNEGPDGLQRLDYALAKAAEVGVKLVLVLTNNWYDFGGMDQYLRWYGREKHHEFYTWPAVKQAYKDWIEHLVSRKNTVNDRLYRDDPAIFSWELGNEPRCRGTGPPSSGWTKNTIVNWADEMSSYIKSLDPNHLVSVGDEGFFDGGDGAHWAYAANDGVDHEALTALPGVDFGTYHAYPEDWGTTLGWGDQWIIDHERVARRLGKPTVLEEYGVKVTRDPRGHLERGLGDRLLAYERWNDLLMKRGGSASLVWMLGGLDTLNPAATGLYRDYDGYTVYRGDESTSLLAELERRFVTRAPACQQLDTPSNETPSPFVRVRRAQRANERVAFGWATSGG